ncbi:sensor domain-containing diguanylate cyclase [Marinobacterium lutimaris]|uniref:PAS domain S-box-containing protein/diguanylate cyclase (GGDEF) domain-containing protein n=1 Tax=Marinobacterium lutimaris TaxID=568106 RepID=A0A1H5UXF1_9GAMM|nr:diguanylate cyclase [Marinobacterium lutimaris]SEF79693.1 PAS domain S-box-containing protein/diguanylate cyclase (GGDEF) domain-containing protein [Marinobacterium lutimaris]
MSNRLFSLVPKPISVKAPGAAVIAVLVMLLGAMALGLAWGLYWDYRQTLDKAAGRMQLQVRAFTNAFDMAFAGADHSLHEVREELESGNLTAQDQPALRREMFRHILESPYLNSLTLYGVDGNLQVSVGERSSTPGMPVWLAQMLEGRIQSQMNVRAGQLAAAVLVQRYGEEPSGVLVAELDRDAVLAELESGRFYTHQQLFMVDVSNHVEPITASDNDLTATLGLIKALPLQDFNTRNQVLDQGGELIAIRQVRQQPLRAVAVLDSTHVLLPWMRRSLVVLGGFMFIGVLSLVFMRYWRLSARREQQTNNALYRLYQAVEQMPCSVMVTDLNRRISYVNKSFVQRTGYRMDEILGQEPDILLSERTPDTVRDELRRAVSQHLSWEGELVTRMKDGQERIEELLISPVQDVDGEVSCNISISTDVTDKRDAETRLLRYREIVNVSDELLAMLGTDYRYRQVNRRHLDYLGLSREEIEGHHVKDLYGQQEFEREIKPFVDRIAEGERIVQEKWIEFSGLGKRFIRVTGKPVIASGDRIDTVAISMVDLTARRESEEALSLSEARFRVLSDNLPQGLFEADSRGRILYANRRCREIFGRDLRDLDDENWVNSLQEQDRQRVTDSWRNCIAAAEGHWACQARLLTETGEQRWVAFSARRYQGTGQGDQRYIGTLRDITEETRSRELLERKNSELARLSTTDMLTGLSNRANIEQLLEKEVHRFERYGSCCAVIMMDVDHFKAVNDTCGHAVGDEVLRRVGKLLTQSTRRSDHAGRWGGEEFLVVCSHSTAEGARQLAENLRQKIAATEFPVIGEKTCSFGVAAIRPGDSAREMLARADDALYRAKHAGRNRVELETPIQVVDRDEGVAPTEK